jgi:hypothetical protein
VSTHEDADIAGVGNRFDFERNSIATTSKKTRKSMASRPVSAEVMAELSEYVCGLDVGQELVMNEGLGEQSLSLRSITLLVA